MPEIDVQKFCQDVAREAGAEGNTIPAQVREILGGFHNLYLAETFRRGTSTLKVTTSDGFACEFAPRQRLLSQI